MAGKDWLDISESHDNHVVWCPFPPSPLSIVPATGLTTNNVRLEFDATLLDRVIFTKWSDSVHQAQSHDGLKLAGMSGANTMKIWDPFTGACDHTLSGVTGVTCCALSPDGRHVAIGSGDTSLSIWNVWSGVHVRTVRDCKGGFWSWWRCAYSLDGSLLVATSWDKVKGAKVWNPDTGACICTLRDHAAYVYDCAFSPRDVTLLATTSGDMTVKLWNAQTGVCLGTLSEHISSVGKCAFSPDGVYLAIINHTLSMWNVYTGVCVHIIQPGHTLAYAGTFPNDALLGRDKLRSCTVHVWYVPYHLQNNVKLLLMMLVGNRRWHMWLPSELWHWINTQWFFYR